jgi:hypothetical protein
MVNIEDFADELHFLNIVRRPVGPEYRLVFDVKIIRWFGVTHFVLFKFI